MTYSIELTPEESRRLEEAQRLGIDFARMVRALIAGLPHEGAAAEAEDRTLEEMRRLVQQDFEASGMTEEELGAFANSLVHRIRAQEGTVPTGGE